MKFLISLTFITTLLAAGCSDENKPPTKMDGGDAQAEAGDAMDGRVADDDAATADGATGDAAVDAGPTIDPLTPIADVDDADLMAYCQTEITRRASLRPNDSDIIDLYCKSIAVFVGPLPNSEQECEDATAACIGLADGTVPEVALDSFALDCEPLLTYTGTRTVGDLFDCWDDNAAELERVKSTLTCAAIVADPYGAVFGQPESCTYLYSDFVDP